MTIGQSQQHARALFLRFAVALILVRLARPAALRVAVAQGGLGGHVLRALLRWLAQALVVLMLSHGSASMGSVGVPDR